jgi:hypothetical protein
MRFKVLSAVIMKITVFFEVCHIVWYTCTDISEDTAAPVICPDGGTAG